MSRLTRRPVLAGGLGLLGLGIIGYGGSLAVCAGSAGLPLAAVVPALARLPDPGAVARAWRQVENRGAAGAALLTDPDLARAWRLDDAAAQAALARRIRDDFARGDTVVAGACVVTRLEARLAAVCLA